MKINQLFREKVPEELVERLVRCYGWTGMSDTTQISKEDLVKADTVRKVRAMEEELKRYYLPCKAILYLTDLNEQGCITVLRQIVRLHNKTLHSLQRYIQYNKVTFYYLSDNSVGEIDTSKNSKQTIEGVHLEFN